MPQVREISGSIYWPVIMFYVSGVRYCIEVNAGLCFEISHCHLVLCNKSHTMDTF
jgi:hypothetical protein